MVVIITNFLLACIVICVDNYLYVMVCPLLNLCLFHRCVPGN